MYHPADPNDPTPPIALRYRRRVLYALFATAGLLAALFLLWWLKYTVALIFAALLVGVFLRTGGDAIARLLPGERRDLGLTLFCLLLLALATLFVYFAVPSLLNQADILQERIPQSLQKLREWVMQYGWGKWLLESNNGPQLDQMLQGGNNLARRAMTAMGTALTVAIAIVFLGFTGLYLAAEPKLYRDGAMWLVPPRDRPAATEVFADAGRTLRFWLYGQLAAMALVGTLSGLGLWILGVPLPLINALITFLLCFIPNFGPIASGVPPVLLALTADEGMFGGGLPLALAVVVLYLGVQTVESYIITPMIQKKAVELPPALLITMQLVLGTLIGLIGVAIAAPLTAVGMVVARRLFVVGDMEHEAPEDRAGEEFEADVRPTE